MRRETPPSGLGGGVGVVGGVSWKRWPVHSTSGHLGYAEAEGEHHLSFLTHSARRKL